MARMLRRELRALCAGYGRCSPASARTAGRSGLAQVSEKHCQQVIEDIGTFPLQEVSRAGHDKRTDPVEKGNLAAAHEIIANHVILGAIK